MKTKRKEKKKKKKKKSEEKKVLTRFELGLNSFVVILLV